MNRLKFRQENLLKAIPGSIRAVAAILIPISILVICLRSNANKIGSPPATAIFDRWQGYVRMRRGNGQAQGINKQLQMQSNTDVLEVNGSVGGNEHWAHLLFRRGTNRNVQYPMVQAGTDSGFTSYRFPCKVEDGGVVIGWGLSQNRNRVCERITVGLPGWRSSMGDARIARKSKVRAGSKDTYIAQNTPREIIVEPSDGRNLVYIRNLNGSLVIDVLVGRVTIRSTAPERTLMTVGEGNRYTNSGDGSRGNTQEIPEDVINLLPVKIFLEPDNWSPDVQEDVQQFEKDLNSWLERPENRGRIRDFGDEEDFEEDSEEDSDRDVI
jgi:hypothetical protein